jgi:type IV pilus assembly protein PilP
MISNLKPQITAFFLGLMSLNLGSCSNDHHDLVQYMKNIKKRPAKQVELIPLLKPVPFFKFAETEDTRSPFKPLLVVKPKNRSTPVRKKQPLEAFSLDALKLVGVLEQGKKIWALIKQPDNQIAHVKVGDYIGQNNSQVITINKNLVEVEEKITKSERVKKHVFTLGSVNH